MTIWSYWFPDLLPHLPGCPNILVEHELKRAAQDFFRQSRAWQVVQAPAAVTADDATVAIAIADAGQELVRIEKAWLDGKPLDVKTTEDLDTEFSDDWQVHTGAPGIVLQTSPSVATLYPIPLADAVTGLKLRVSVCPSEAATGIPDDMAIKYRDVMIAGAKSRLMLYSNKPWSNADLAMVNAAMFTAGIGKANLDAARSFGRGRLSARPRWC